MSKKPVKTKSGATPKKGAVDMSPNVAAILGLAAPKSKASPPVKAASNGAARVKPEWVKYHNILMELRERLRNQMAGLAKESAEQLAGYSLHMADSGTDNFDRDFALSLLSSDQDAVYEIEEALKRIEKKTFGICELTGKAIPKARLDAIPWTRFTVEAQMQLEKEGALRSRRLGSLGSVDTVGGLEIEEDDRDEEKPAKESKE
jgi:DnaK suppressor protein